jgi:hypothetical protein
MAGKRSRDAGVPEHRDLSAAIAVGKIQPTDRRYLHIAWAASGHLKAQTQSLELNLRQVIAIGERQMDLDRKLKTALDESRLLILGAQVLFGFLFQAVFQDLFKEVPAAVRCCSALVLDSCF